MLEKNTPLFCSHYFKYVNAIIPKVKQILNKHRPWFTQTCKEYIQDRSKKLRIVKTKPTKENIIAFKIAKRLTC